MLAIKEQGAMPDDKTQLTDGENPEKTPGESDSKEIQNPVAYIAALEKRLQEQKDERKKLSDRLSAMETAQQKRMQESGQYEDLYKKTLTEIEALRPFQEKAERYEQRTRERNEQKIERIPEISRSAIPVKYSPEDLADWLEVNEPLLTRKPAPETDAGAGGAGSRKVVNLTDEERQVAADMGMTEEDYIKNKR
ncbi:MAG: hypothetical protein ACPG7F_00730 [Aggregatilineales bacterium]